MVWTQQLRQKWFGPPLQWCALRGLKPDHLTLMSLISGLGFMPLFFWNESLALCALALHVILDGLDGPLARIAKIASRRGSFTDTTSDQIVVTVTTITIMCPPNPLIELVPGITYIFVYTVVVVFAMVRNTMNIPYGWLVRPRFIVYICIFSEINFFVGITNYVVWFFTLYLGINMVSGFFQIRKSL